MMKEYLWQNNDPVGWEHIRLDDDHPGWDVVDSVLMRVDANTVRRGGYTLVVDKSWHALEIRCLIENEPGVMGSVHILSEGDGVWYDENEQHLSALDGCLDISIQGSPITPTLPLQRLGLQDGQTAELVVVEISLVDLSLRPVRIQLRHDGSTLWYERDGVTSELTLDADGFVRDIAGRSQRMFPADA
ncbi:MAG: putative glycolipid-binding domain-containing protein [Thermomicrobiales bacterium]|nr:putative glycolipid-binding domain-containing protein [Thermomicrobiales bacterium]